MNRGNPQTAHQLGARGETQYRLVNGTGRENLKTPGEDIRADTNLITGNKPLEMNKKGGLTSPMGLRSDP